VIWDYAIERQLLEAAGAELVIDRARPRTAIVDADIVIVHEERLDAEAIGSAGRCVGIVATSVGTNQVDREAASAAGIAVRNCPTYCTDEVADHALALTLAVERRLADLADGVTRSDWDPFHYVERLRRLRGQTMGIVGAGRIGRQVAIRARAFGFRTIAHDPYVADAPDDLPLVELDELLASSDVVVLTLPLTDRSERMIDARAIGLMHPTSVLINVSRGRLVDEAALAAALRAGTIGGAGLDVRVEEPPVRDVLAGAPNLVLTPHVAGVSRASFDDLHREAATAAIELLRDAGRLGPPAGTARDDAPTP
jgi:D-3-phosphoglycerate dehydrogenase